MFIQIIYEYESNFIKLLEYNWISRILQKIMGKKTKTMNIPDMLILQDQNNSVFNNPSQLVKDDISSHPLYGVLNIVYVGFFTFLNTFLMACAYFLMVFQTVYILSASQPKYINLRHIAIKWIIIYGFIEIKRGYSQKLDINSQLMIFFIDILILLIAFPSRTLKTIHLKYFSHKQQKKFQNSVKDPKTYDITFGQRLLTAFIIYSLQILKHLIAFVPPNFRKSVQQPVRNINKVMIQRKCFWSIYQQSKQSEEQVERAKNKMIQYLVPRSKTPTTTSFNPSKDLQIRALAQQCSTHTMKPIKKISIKYNPLNSELEITDLDFNKAIVYILQQVNQQDNVTIQFKAFQNQSTQQETIIARFKSSKQLQNFVRSIEQAQSMI